MKEIKFRAWDKESKRMGIVNWLCPREKEVFKVRCWFGDDDKELIGNQFELMQFTGLLDKNGKEIYENDITESGIVIFIGGRYVILDNQTEDLEDLMGDGDEVMGNVFENPELLTNPL